MTPAVDAAIRRALDVVVDPCSVQAGAPLGLLDLGLVAGWELGDDGHLVVRLCLTSPGCTLFPQMIAAAEAELARIPEVRTAAVELDLATVWTEARMTEDGRDALARRRRASVERFALRRRVPVT